MKNKINDTINKLIAFAEDNLMLDMLDGDYARNRLATLVGVVPEAEDADYGKQDFISLFNELKAAAPDITPSAVADIVLPLPHTINYYFTDELARNRDKAYDFLFGLFETVGSVKKTADATDAISLVPEVEAGARAILLTVGSDDLKYTPLVSSNRVAALECPDFMSEDITAREAAFVDEFGGFIAKKAGDGSYACCEKSKITSAKVKDKLSDGAVKICSLDYSSPALAISGPKNSAARTAAKIIMRAADAGIDYTVAAAAGELITFYITLAGDPSQIAALTSEQ